MARPGKRIKEKDRIYSQPLRHIEDFCFDENVARVFEDMIRRSVPGYESIIPMMGMLARHYYLPGTRVFDLGSSLGASATAMARGISSGETHHVIAVDNSLPMIRESKKLLQKMNAVRILLVCTDIQKIRIKKASLVALNFTLQFLPPGERQVFLKTIHEGLVTGGALVLSEKVTFDHAEEQHWQTHLHTAFKRFHGYSDLEISQKRTALENKMQPETFQTHVERLKSVGFKAIYKWFQCFNFISIVAEK